MANKKLVLVGIGIIFLGALLAGVDYVVQQKSSMLSEPVLVQSSEVSASDWKQFTDKDAGFAIQYPDSWVAPLKIVNVTTGVISLNFEKKVIVTYYPKAADLPNNEQGLSLDRWLASPTNYYFNMANVGHLENVVIGDDYPTIKTYTSYCNGAPLLANEYFTPKNAGSINEEHSNIYQIEGPLFDCPPLPVTDEARNLYSQSYNQYEKVVEHMVASFRINK